MNFLDARVVEGSAVFENISFELPLSPDLQDKLVEYNRKRIQIGIRPENVAVNESQEGLDTEVTAIEKIGDGVILHLQVEGETFTAKTDATQSFERGETITIAFSERLHVFNDEGEIIARTSEGFPWTPRVASTT
jgi:ABC-type sugar transport system ATPase subunit